MKRVFVIALLLLCSCTAKDRVSRGTEVQSLRNPLCDIPAQAIAAVVVGEGYDYRTGEVRNTRTIVDDEVVRQLFEQASGDEFREHGFLSWYGETPYVFLGKDGNVLAAGTFQLDGHIFFLCEARMSRGRFFIGEPHFGGDLVEAGVKVSDMNRVVFDHLTEAGKLRGFNIPHIDEQGKVNWDRGDARQQGGAAGPMTVLARVAVASKPPRPRVDPFSEAVTITLYDVVKVEKGSFAPTSLLAVEWVMRDFKLLKAAQYRPGDLHRLNLVPYAGKEREDPSIAEVKQFDDTFDLSAPFWVESAEAVE